MEHVEAVQYPLEIAMCATHLAAGAMIHYRSLGVLAQNLPINGGADDTRDLNTKRYLRFRLTLVENSITRGSRAMAPSD